MKNKIKRMQSIAKLIMTLSLVTAGTALVRIDSNGNSYFPLNGTLWISLITFNLLVLGFGFSLLVFYSVAEYRFEQCK